MLFFIFDGNFQPFERGDDKRLAQLALQGGAK